MLVPFFDLSAQVRTYRDELHALFDETIDDGLFIGGRALDDFEGKYSSFLKVGYATGVGNGLDALRLVLEGWGVGPGDEVIVPGFSFYATWLAVMQVGATPVFVDVERASANIDPVSLQGALSSKTKAIIAVHLYGWPARMSPILELAERHGIKVLEDAAQAHGALVEGRMVGSLGDAAAFSFYPTKNLGALGDGGAVTTNDGDLARFVASRRSYGVGATKYDHCDFGWNSRLDSLQAAFLSLGLARLGAWNKSRQVIASRYREALVEVAGSVVGPISVETSVWHHFILRCKDREQVREFLRSNGVTSDIHYPYFAGSVAPVRDYLQKLGGEGEMTLFDHLSASRSLSKQVISLPIGPWMSEEQITHVSRVLEQIPKDLLSN